jgi:hypothetical protein
VKYIIGKFIKWTESIFYLQLAKIYLLEYVLIYNLFWSYILEAREMPILSMLDTIFYKTMQRVETKQGEAEKMPGIIFPKIKKKIDKFTEWSLGATVMPAANGLYHASTGEFERHCTVDFSARSCDCRRWQISGIP